MKQLYLIVVIAFSFTLFGQNNWPKEGAQWDICFNTINWGEPTTYSHNSTVHYTRDTVVNELVYQVSERLFQDGERGASFVTRYQNDTIFRLINGNEYLFFTYNASLGDTLFMQRTGVEDYDQDTCSFSLELKCTEIFEITIEGNSYSCWEFQDVGNSVYGVNNIGSHTEHCILNVIKFNINNIF